MLKGSQKRKIFMFLGGITAISSVPLVAACSIFAEEVVLATPSEAVEYVTSYIANLWSSTKISPLFLQKEDGDTFEETVGFVTFSSQDFWNKTGISFLLGFYESDWKGVEISYSIKASGIETYSRHSYIVVFRIAKGDFVKEISRRIEVFKSRDLMNLDNSISSNLQLFQNFIPFKKSRTELTNSFVGLEGTTIPYSKFAAIYKNKMEIPKNMYCDVTIGKRVVSTNYAGTDLRNGIIFPLKFNFYSTHTIINRGEVHYKEKLIEFPNLIFSAEFEGKDANGISNKTLDTEENVQIDSVNSMFKLFFNDREFIYSTRSEPANLLAGQIILEPHNRLGISPLIIALQAMKFNIYFDSKREFSTENGVRNALKFRAVTTGTTTSEELNFEVIFDFSKDFENTYAKVSAAQSYFNERLQQSESGKIDAHSKLDSAELDLLLDRFNEGRDPISSLRDFEIFDANSQNKQVIDFFVPVNLYGNLDYSIVEQETGLVGKIYEIQIYSQIEEMPVLVSKYTIKSNNYEK